MLWMQLACVAIILSWLAWRVPRAPRAALLRLTLFALAAWAAEDSMIRVWHYYRYADGWWLRIDQVPLLVVVIWPIVIDSAGRLAACLVTPRTHAPGAFHRMLVAGVGASIVLADAALIEPVSVRAGLWSWVAPGLFDVPLIGICGWAFFAFAALAVLGDGTDARSPGWTSYLAPIAVPLATHAMVLVAWWGLFRWVQGPIDAELAVTVAWLALGTFTVAALVTRLRHRIPLWELVMRVPGAAFFFALLAVRARDDWALVAWTSAMVPPYLALLDVKRDKLEEAP